MDSSLAIEPPPIVLDVEGALRAVRSVVGPTPLVRAPDLDGAVGRSVWLKLESLQATGSFKVRGAAAHMTALEPHVRARGVVTCSSGNHGRAVAFVAERFGVPATVCVPEWVDAVKLRAIRGHGAEAVLAGASYDEAEARALALAEEEGLTFVPPFDDEAVAAGQATVALEVLEQLPRVAEVAVPLSGGGLVGGMAWVLAQRAPRVRVTAVSAMGARVMWNSLRAGRVVEAHEEETLATALSGGIGHDNRVTFRLVRDYVHRHLLVPEIAIEGAIRRAYRDGLLVEGGGAVGIAALLNGGLATPESLPGVGDRPLVVVVSGGNLDLDTLAPLLEGPPL
jgi:threonine dehydratase